MDLDKKLSELEEKYCQLVWYARKPLYENQGDWLEYFADTPDDVILTCRQKMQEVEAEYPEETNSLKSPDGGDWSHGFNSGCLAILRYIAAAKSENLGIEHAEEFFPELDT